MERTYFLKKTISQLSKYTVNSVAKSLSLVSRYPNTWKDLNSVMVECKLYKKSCILWDYDECKFIQIFSWRGRAVWQAGSELDAWRSQEVIQYFTYSQYNDVGIESRFLY